jgi:hypothetical protein
VNYKSVSLVAFGGLVCSSAFGSGYAANTFDTFGNWNAVPNGYYVDVNGAGMRFQAMASGSVTNITAAISDYQLGPALPVNFQIWTDSGNGSNTGALGSQVGTTWSGATSGQPWNTALPISVNIGGGPMLTAGNWYWLVAQSGTPGLRLDWSLSLTTPNPFNYFMEGGVATTDLANEGAYSVSVVATPEPYPFAVLGVGVLGLMRRRKRG